MAKKNVNARLSEEIIEAIDAYAEAHKLTRTGAIEALVAKGLEPESKTNASSEVYDLLRQSNADLRMTVSTLTAQLAHMNRLADNAQQMQAAMMVKRLPERTGIFARVAAWMHPQSDSNQVHYT